MQLPDLGGQSEDQLRDALDGSRARAGDFPREPFHCDVRGSQVGCTRQSRSERDVRAGQGESPLQGIRDGAGSNGW